MEGGGDVGARAIHAGDGQMVGHHFFFSTRETRNGKTCFFFPCLDTGKFNNRINHAMVRYMVVVVIRFFFFVCLVFFAEERRSFLVKNGCLCVANQNDTRDTTEIFCCFCEIQICFDYNAAATTISNPGSVFFFLYNFEKMSCEPQLNLKRPIFLFKFYLKEKLRKKVLKPRVTSSSKICRRVVKLVISSTQQTKARESSQTLARHNTLQARARANAHA